MTPALLAIAGLSALLLGVGLLLFRFEGSATGRERWVVAMYVAGAVLLLASAGLVVQP